MRILLRWLLIATFQLAVFPINALCIALALFFWDGSYIDRASDAVKPFFKLVVKSTTKPVLYEE